MKSKYTPSLFRSIPMAIALALASATSLLATPAYAGGDQSALPSRLSDAKISLADGIKHAEQSGGFPISAKFEMAGQELALSVYTAKQGRNVAAEQNELIELQGAATKPAWTPEKEVFADKPHIARASMHLTVMQQSKLNLADVVKKAATQQQGTIYSITPAIQNGHPVFKLLALTSAGKVAESWVDLAGNRVGN